MLFIKSVNNNTKKEILINVDHIIYVRPNHAEDNRSDVMTSDGEIITILSPFAHLASLISIQD